MTRSTNTTGMLVRGGLLLAIAGGALLAPRRAPAQDEETDRIRVVALSGDDHDSFAPDELLTVYGARDTLALAPNGAVLFDGAASNGVTSRPLWFLASGGDTEVVMERFAAAPAPFGALTVGTVQAALLGRTGNVGFELYLTGSPNTEALATWMNEALTFGAAAPGDFVDLRLGDRAFNGETLVFEGTVASAPVAPRYTSSTAGIWRRTGTADPVVVLQQDQAVPGLSGSIVDSIFTVPIVHESGATAFDVRLDSSSPGRALLVYPGPANGSTPTVASVLGPTDQLRDVTFGDIPAEATIPRWAYVVSDGNGTHAVDSGRGTVISDGDVVGDLTVKLDSRSRIAAVDGDVILVMAHAIEGSSTVEALWRCVPDQDPVCELRVGQPIDDFNGAAQTISDIWNVHVNEQGRVAAEVDIALFGTTQVIVIQDEPGGPYRTVIQQREWFQADRDAYRVVSIQSQRPSSFTFTDPGHDGHQTRFAANGDFVFPATVDTASDSTDHRGVFVLGGVGPNLCDVEAKVRGGHLQLTNDDCDARLTVRVLEGGDYILRPGEGTSVNGQEGEVSISAPGDLRIAMGGGADNVVIESSYGDSDVGLVPGGLVVDMGPGDDDLTVDYVDFGGSVSIEMGRDRGSLEKIHLDAMGVDGNLRVVCGPTRTLCFLEGVGVGGSTFVQHGGDMSTVTLEACAFFEAVFKGTPGYDRFTFRRCLLDGPVKVDLGSGFLDDAKFFECEGEDAPLTVSGKKSGAVTIRLEDCDFDRGNMKLTTGKLGSTVALVGTTVTDHVDVKTSGVGTEGNAINTLSFQNSFIFGRLKIKGKGNHAVSMTGQAIVGEGIDIKLKGGSGDQVSIGTDTTVESGWVKIATKATGGSQIVLDLLEVEDGSISVKGGKGADVVIVTDGILVDGGRIKLGPGDDTLTMGTLISYGGFKVDGGPGNDRFDFGSGIDDIDDGVKSKGFETGSGPGVPESARRR